MGYPLSIALNTTATYNRPIPIGAQAVSCAFLLGIEAHGLPESLEFIFSEPS